MTPDELTNETTKQNVLTQASRTTCSTLSFLTQMRVLLSGGSSAGVDGGRGKSM